MPPKTFTRAEAEELLPTVEPILRDICQWRVELAGVEERLAQLRAKAMGNGHAHPREDDDPRAEARRLGRQIAEAVAMINGLGVEVKELETGLIDFPSLRDGRIVYLCWRLGEGRIAWWHEVDAGFAGRTPLDDE